VLYVKIGKCVNKLASKGDPESQVLKVNKKNKIIPLQGLCGPG